MVSCGEADLEACACTPLAGRVQGNASVTFIKRYLSSESDFQMFIIAKTLPTQKI